MGNGEAIRAVEIFELHRPLLFGLAYRMLGSIADAEDVVQEAFLRWHRATEHGDRTPVQSPKAYLTTIVTRLCIDQLRSARAQREAYIGLWLPEPLVEADMTTPDMSAELAESLSLALLTLLERLRPVERAVFLLRQVFDYDYATIAQIVQRSDEHCRQMMRRAQQHLAGSHVRSTATPEQTERLTRQFLNACLHGDLDGLIELLTADIVLYTDGGDKQTAARKPVVGAARVARFLLGVLDKAPAGFTARMAVVNGQPGIISYVGTMRHGAVSLAIRDDRIRSIYMVVNPDKLSTVPPNPGGQV